MPLNQRMDKENVLHFVHNGVLLSGIKQDIFKFVDKWMELQKTFLSEVNNTQNDKYGMYSA